MSEAKCCSGDCASKSGHSAGANGAGGAVYGMAFLGAAYYFIQHATTLGMGLLGIVKAIFWPAVLIYKVLGYLNM